MDLDDIKNAMKFFNWEMILAIALLTTAWAQLLKKYIPDIVKVGRVSIPILVIVILLSGMGFSHLIFDMASVKHTESVALFTGFAGALFSLLGYDLLKGTKLGLRSTDELKK